MFKDPHQNSPENTDHYDIIDKYFGTPLNSETPNSEGSSYGRLPSVGTTASTDITSGRNSAALDDETFNFTVTKRKKEFSIIDLLENPDKYLPEVLKREYFGFDDDSAAAEYSDYQRLAQTERQHFFGQLNNKLQSRNKFKHFLAVGVALRNLSECDPEHYEQEFLRLDTFTAFMNKDNSVRKREMFNCANRFDAFEILKKNTKFLCERYVVVAEHDANRVKARLLAKIVKAHVQLCLEIVRASLADPYRHVERSFINFFVDELPSLVQYFYTKQCFATKFIPSHQDLVKNLHADGLWSAKLELINQQIAQFVNPWAAQDMRLTQNEHEYLLEVRRINPNTCYGESAWGALYTDLLFRCEQPMVTKVGNAMLWYLGCHENTFAVQMTRMLQQVKMFAKNDSEQYFSATSSRYGAV